MNNWIHTTLRKPTKADGNKDGFVLVLFPDESVGSRPWDTVSINDVDVYVAWMQILKYDPIPPVPEGYELLTDYNSQPDGLALLLSVDNMWESRRLCRRPYNKRDIYCVPKPAWVPAIVTSRLLAPGTWLTIDIDNEWCLFPDKPTWNGSSWSSEKGDGYLVILFESPKITGEKAIWQIGGGRD